jgi:LPXTG-motif cell wall-anchored protein
VAAVTGAVRGSLTVLASERNRAGYARVANLVDGDAYYWSSADPFHTPGYVRKLRSMGRAVHRHHGLWIAPAAAGFDARLIGGTRVVSRRGGATLRRALDVAATTAPDAIGIISWNEFSENSHIEPSRTYGFQELRTLADVLGAQPPVTADLDSSDSPATGAQYGLPLLGGFVVTLLSGGALLARRRRRHRAVVPPR